MVKDVLSSRSSSCCSLLLLYGPRASILRVCTCLLAFFFSFYFPLFQQLLGFLLYFLFGEGIAMGPSCTMFRSELDVWSTPKHGVSLEEVLVGRGRKTEWRFVTVYLTT